jgi:hypothetical protein
LNNENKFYLIYKHLIFHLIRKYKELISYTKFEFHSFNSWDINEPQNHILDNDANGIGWFNIECLESLIKEQKVAINQHTKILIKKFFGKNITH